METEAGGAVDVIIAQSLVVEEGRAVRTNAAAHPTDDEIKNLRTPHAFTNACS